MIVYQSFFIYEDYTSRIACTMLLQALPAVEYSSNVRQWHAAQMAPDLAMLVLIAFYVGLVVYDTISTWSIERKSRQNDSPPANGLYSLATDGNTAAPPNRVTKFRSRTSLASIIFELCLCGVMLGAVATWYYYATALVQDGAFSTG